jgi:hypothetical protein
MMMLMTLMTWYEGAIRTAFGAWKAWFGCSIAMVLRMKDRIGIYINNRTLVNIQDHSKFG